MLAKSALARLMSRDWVDLLPPHNSRYTTSPLRVK